MKHGVTPGPEEHRLGEIRLKADREIRIEAPRIVLVGKVKGPFPWIEILAVLGWLAFVVVVIIKAKS